MATSSGLIADVTEEPEYNARLYKGILNSFKQYVDALHFKDAPPIISILSLQDFEKVESKHKMEGNSAASGLLLDCMKRKHNWFAAFIEAMKIPYLKMEEHIPRFLKLKEMVDKEWKEEKKKRATQPGMPAVRKTQTPGNIAVDSENNNAPPKSDFWLSPVTHPEDESDGLQVDAFTMDDDENTERKRPLSSSLSQGDQVDGGSRATFYLENKDQQTGAEHGDTSPSYVDARSGINVYSGLQSTSPAEDSPYTQLTSSVKKMSFEGPNSLQVDAQIEMTQAQEQSMSSTPQQETTGQGQQRTGQTEGQQAQAPERRVFTNRREHPSLSTAITDSPQKDFTEDFVAEELCQMAGWVAFSEETNVMDLLKPRLHEDGHYVIWYWALAKRPTVCVTHKRKMLTFVVHKSSGLNLANCMFYINKQQKKLRSLKDLIKYHLDFGVLHTKRDSPAENILLKTPIT